MKLRRPAIALVALLGSFAGCCGLFTALDRRQVRRIVAEQTECPADSLSVLREEGLFETRYLLSGCGGHYAMLCAPQDPGGCAVFEIPPQEIEQWFGPANRQ